MVNEQLVHEVVGALLGERSLRVVVVVERREDVTPTFEAVALGLGAAVTSRGQRHLIVANAPPRVDPSLQVVEAEGALIGSRLDRVWTEPGVREGHTPWWRMGIAGRLCRGAQVHVVGDARSSVSVG